MAIRADSYSSTSEVKAFTRHLLGGQSAFNSTTRPTATEVEKFIDRVSGYLNVALWKIGFDPTSIRANSTAKLSCDDWVTARSAEYVELTQRGTGYSDDEGSRTGVFRNLYTAADKFVDEMVLGWKYMGVAVSHPVSAGLAFTGLAAQDNRADPSDSSIVQPHFRRGQFDNPESVDTNQT